MKYLALALLLAGCMTDPAPRVHLITCQTADTTKTADSVRIVMDSCGYGDPRPPIGATFLGGGKP